jgi:hypothetical protein
LLKNTNKTTLLKRLNPNKIKEIKMPEQIEKLMLKEHKKLNKLLDDLERDLHDYEKTKRNFNCFKWNVEKHFFVEEKVIFDMFVDISGQETNDIFHLLQDHVKIMGMLKILEQRLKRKIKPFLHELKQTLITHRNFEDEDFYPMLDERLSKIQKKFVCERVMEVIPC